MNYLFFFLVTLPLFCSAQKSERFVSSGLLSGMGTLAIGLPKAYSGTNAYVSGNLEYYLENNISVKGGVWIFLGTSGAENTLFKNSNLFTGFYYHFPTKNAFDPYLGFEPGINWSQLQPHGQLEVLDENYTTFPTAINPSAAIASGINYFASQSVHLFVEGKYLFGIHTSDIAPVSLNEFRFAFGFGFNLWAK